MTPENKKFLDDNLHIFLVWERAFYVKNLGVHNREEMTRVLREEFNPQYNGCGSCDKEVGDMLTSLYRGYHDWLKKEYNDDTVYKDISEGIIEMNKQPVTVEANFPSNKDNESKV
jgi:hypothetical protein